MPFLKINQENNNLPFTFLNNNLAFVFCFETISSYSLDWLRPYIPPASACPVDGITGVYQQSGDVILFLSHWPNQHHMVLSMFKDIKS